MGELYERKQAELAREGKLPPPKIEKDYYTVREIAEGCGVTVSTVYRWINRGGLGTLNANGRWNITKEEWHQYLNRQAEALEYQQRESAAHSYGQYLIRRRQHGGINTKRVYW